jgi:hypothetical protein
MNASYKLAAATVAVYLFLVALAAAVHFLLLAGTVVVPGEAAGEVAMSLADRNAALVMLALAVGGGVWFALRQFHERYVRSALRMAEELDVAEANSALRIGEYDAAELRVLGKAVNRLAATREALEQDVAGQVR